MTAEPGRVATQESFWSRLMVLVERAVQVADRLLDQDDPVARQTFAVELVETWYRASGLKLPYVPRFIERRIVHHLASGLVEAVLEFIDRYTLLTEIPEETPHARVPGTTVPA